MNSTNSSSGKTFIGPCMDVYPPGQNYIPNLQLAQMIGMTPATLNLQTLRNVRAAFEKTKLWKIGQDILIHFLDGTSQDKDWVKSQVNQKLAPILNLNFIWDAPNVGSDIRISFAQKGAAWSYIGTDARGQKVTMNLGWLDDSRDTKSYFAGQGTVVIHEFGHALGMIHEHQNPVGNTLKWNEAKLNEAFSGPPNNWDEETIYNNIYKKYNATDLNASVYDPKSIMHYFFPPDFFMPPPPNIPHNCCLSDMDITWLKKMYPGSGGRGGTNPGVTDTGKGKTGGGGVTSICTVINGVKSCISCPSCPVTTKPKKSASTGTDLQKIPWWGWLLGALALSGIIALVFNMMYKRKVDSLKTSATSAVSGFREGAGRRGVQVPGRRPVRFDDLGGLDGRGF